MAGGGWWVVVGGWRVAVGGWRLVGGGWRLVGGGWWVAVGGWRLVGGGWRLVGGGWWVAGGGWWVAVGGWRLMGGGWWVAVGGWWLMGGGWRPGSPFGMSLFLFRFSFIADRTAWGAGTTGNWRWPAINRRQLIVNRGRLAGNGQQFLPMAVLLGPQRSGSVCVCAVGGGGGGMKGDSLWLSAAVDGTLRVIVHRGHPTS